MAKVFIISSGNYSDCRIHGIYPLDAKPLYDLVVSEVEKTHYGSPLKASLLAVAKKHGVTIEVPEGDDWDGDCFLPESEICKLGILVLKALGFKEYEFEESNTDDYCLKVRG